MLAITFFYILKTHVDEWERVAAATNFQADVDNPTFRTSRM
jgi:hypothetical protein